MNPFLLTLGGRWSIGSIKGIVTAWLIGEVLSFLIAVKLMGLGTTLLIMIGTSILGMALLRRIGLDAVRQFRRGALNGGGGTDAGFVDGTLGALGAVLLILPGFVSDAAGLALATPSLRQALSARLVAPVGARSASASGRRAAPDVIDLAPEDWRVVDKRGRV